MSHTPPNQTTSLEGESPLSAPCWVGQEGMSVLSNGGLFQALELGPLHGQILRSRRKPPYFNIGTIPTSFPHSLHSFIFLFFFLVFFKLAHEPTMDYEITLTGLPVFLFKFIEIYLCTIKFTLFRDIVW